MLFEGRGLFVKLKTPRTYVRFSFSLLVRFGSEAVLGGQEWEVLFDSVSIFFSEEFGY